jgi:hypothetical protein
LDVSLEVWPVLALQFWLTPSLADTGASVQAEIILQGAVGQTFEARTRLPAGVGYANDSGQSQVGHLYASADEVIWSGTLDATTAQARFDVVVLTQETSALALQTTLHSPGYTPLVIERRLIVNGHRVRLPLMILNWPY